MCHARMCHAYCFSLNPGWKKMQFQLALNKTFCPTPTTLAKINKTMISVYPSSAFHTRFTISELKSRQGVYPNGN